MDFYEVGITNRFAAVFFMEIECSFTIRGLTTQILFYLQFSRPFLVIIK